MHYPEKVGSVMLKDEESWPDVMRSVTKYLLVAWFITAAIDVMLVVASDNSALYASRMPLEARLGLLGYELVALAGLTVVAVSPLAAAIHHSNRLSGRIPFLTVRGSAYVWAGVLTAMFAGSWMGFRNVGQFFNASTFRFFVADPSQILQHVVHMGAGRLAILGGVVALTAVALVRGIPHLCRKADVGHVRTLAVVAALVLSAGATAAWRAHGGVGSSPLPVGDPDTGVTYSWSDYFDAAKDDRTGPAAHIVAEIRRSFSDPISDLGTSKEVRIERRRRISNEAYLARTDTSGLRRMNVIILLVESLRTDQLQAFGGDRTVMPTVDSLAEESWIFTNAYTQASHSNYSDMAPLSSHYPLRDRHYHIYPEDPPYPRVLIYDVLDRLGYEVGVFSSQNENWGGMINYLRTGSIDRFFHAESYSGDTYARNEDAGFAAFGGKGQRSGKIDDHVTVKEANEWIAEKRGDPFFIYMNLQNSHVPYVTPANFDAPFEPEEPSFPIRFNNFPRDSVETVKNIYGNSLAYVDAQISRLVRALKEENALSRTVLVITGDTGQAFYEHGFAAHANDLYNEVMKVPVIVSGPGLPRCSDNRLMEHIDIPPTLFDVLGLQPHPSFQGVSLAREDVPDRSVHLVAQTPLAHQYAIVRDGHKLIYDVRTENSILYDLRSDPGETVNLSDRRQELTVDLENRLGSWVEAQLDYYESSWLVQRYYPPVVRTKGETERERRDTLAMTCSEAEAPERTSR